MLRAGELVRLFVGDDWAEDHHDVELRDAAGRVLARTRLAEGVAGMARLHELVGQQLGEDADEEDAAQVAVGIETDRGPWVQALIAAGYTVYPAAVSAATQGPRSVSIPTATCPASSSSASSPSCPPTIACSLAMPATPSGSRAFASRRPPASISSTS